MHVLLAADCLATSMEIWENEVANRLNCSLPEELWMPWTQMMTAVSLLWMRIMLFRIAQPKRVPLYEIRICSIAISPYPTGIRMLRVDKA